MIPTLPWSSERNSDGISRMSTAPDNAIPTMHITSNKVPFICASSRLPHTKQPCGTSHGKSNRVGRAWQ